MLAHMTLIFSKAATRVYILSTEIPNQFPGCNQRICVILLFSAPGYFTGVVSSPHAGQASFIFKQNYGRSTALGDMTELLDTVAVLVYLQFWSTTFDWRELKIPTGRKEDRILLRQAMLPHPPKLHVPAGKIVKSNDVLCMNSG